METGQLQNISFKSFNTMPLFNFSMGAYHDFIEVPTITARYDSIGNICTGVGGIMDYDLFVEKWTQCSREDFEAYFRYIRSEDSGFFFFFFFFLTHWYFQTYSLA